MFIDIIAHGNTKPAVIQVVVFNACVLVYSITLLISSMETVVEVAVIDNESLARKQ